jgi:DNA-binding IclR family transcriptional regulator
VVAVLNLLAGLPANDGLALSQIARELGISTSTCGVVLASLRQAGYVDRRPDLTYHLGAGLLPIVQTVHRDLPVLASAEVEMQSLVRNTRYPCTLARADVDRLTVVAVQDAPQRSTIGIRAGDSFPLHPPYGAVVFAFAEPAVQQRWVTSAGDDIGLEEANKFQSFLADARENGFAAWRFEPLGLEAVRVIHRVLGDLGDRPQDGRVRDELVRVFGRIQTGYLSDELMTNAPLSVSYLGVPVFDLDARPRFQLELHILERELPSSTFWKLVDELKVSATTITRGLGGDWDAATARATTR